MVPADDAPMTNGRPYAVFQLPARGADIAVAKLPSWVVGGTTFRE